MAYITDHNRSEFGKSIFQRINEWHLRCRSRDPAASHAAAGPSFKVPWPDLFAWSSLHWWNGARLDIDHDLQLQKARVWTTVLFQMPEDNDKSDSEDSKKGRKSKAKPSRDRQQEALASGRIKPAHLKPSKLVGYRYLGPKPDPCPLNGT